MACAWSTDEKLVAVAGGIASNPDAAFITVMDLEQGTEVARLPGNPPVTRALAFAPEGYGLVSGGRDGRAIIWDLEAGEARHAMQHELAVCGVAWSPDGERIATATGTDPAKPAQVGLWQRDGGFVKALAGHAGGAYGIGFSPDGEWIASSGLDGTIRIHDAHEGNEMMVMRGHEGMCWTCDISRDGERIASGSHDGTVRIWSSAGTEIAKLERHEQFVAAVRWNHDGDQLLSAGQDGGLHVWRSDGTFRTSLPSIGPVWALAVSRTGHVAIAALDGTVSVLPDNYVW
jgi:WD40 repeat protein